MFFVILQIDLDLYDASDYKTFFYYKVDMMYYTKPCQYVSLFIFVGLGTSLSYFRRLL